jgi:hypothetical protein
MPKLCLFAYFYASIKIAASLPNNARCTISGQSAERLTKDESSSDHGPDAGAGRDSFQLARKDTEHLRLTELQGDMP